MTAYVDINAPSPNACSKKNGLFVSENFLTFKLNRDKKCQKIEKKRKFCYFDRQNMFFVFLESYVIISLKTVPLFDAIDFALFFCTYYIS